MSNPATPGELNPVFGLPVVSISGVFMPKSGFRKSKNSSVFSREGPDILGFPYERSGPAMSIPPKPSLFGA